jgi:hypothetical protein
MFTCNTCKSKKKKGPSLKDIFSKLDLVLSRLDATDERFEHIKNDIHSLEATLDMKIDQKIEDKMKSTAQINIQEQVSQCFRECKERDRRRASFMIFNLSDTQTKDENAKREDREKVELILEGINVTASITNLARVGKKGDGTRPLRVTTETESQQRKIIQNSWKVKNLTNYENVAFAPDRTRQQREERKELVAQLWDRRANVEDDLVIRGNQIVKKN